MLFFPFSLMIRLHFSYHWSQILSPVFVKTFLQVFIIQGNKKDFSSPGPLISFSGTLSFLLGVLIGMTTFKDHCTLLRICIYGRRKAKSRSSPKSLYHSLLANVHLLYMSQPYFDKKNYYFTRGLNQKWTSQIIPKKIKKSNSIFDGNFFSTRINQVRHQRFFQDVLCLNW